MSSPHDLSLPIREGFRELRRTIRREARGGEISRAILGAPAPTVHVAQLADRFFTRAEHMAMQVLRGGRSELPATVALTRFAELFGGRAAARLPEGAATYDRCGYRLLAHALRTAGGEGLVSEQAVARAGDRILGRLASELSRDADGIAALCAANAVALFDARPIRLDAAQLGGAVADERAANASAALGVSLALACALRHPAADAATILSSAGLVAETKLADWLPWLEGRREGEARLSAAFRAVLPVLP